METRTCEKCGNTYPINQVGTLNDNNGFPHAICVGCYNQMMAAQQPAAPAPQPMPVQQPVAPAPMMNQQPVAPEFHPTPARNGMRALVCEMCNSTDIVKDGDYFVCQACGMRYTPEAARKMMIDGTVDVQGTVRVDNSGYVEKYLQNARRALDKEDWEEVEKYYNMVEQNVPDNMEAVFFSSYGKAMLSLTDSDYYKRQQKFNVLNKSMQVISDYFETTNENKEQVLRKISQYIQKMYNTTFVYQQQSANLAGAINSVAGVTGSRQWCVNLLNSTRAAFVTELQQIQAVHPELFYLSELIAANTPQNGNSSGGCYVATAVYGSYDCPQVWTLRRYRDYTLAKTWYGRLFIKTYYAISPTLVKWFGHTNWFKKMWKGKLDRMVQNLNAQGVEDTPYQDREW